MNYKIEWKGSPNFRPQSGIAKKFIVFHWIVGTLDSATATFQNASRKVATNYGVGEGRIHQYVKDGDYAFGSGNTYANTYGISIEHEGGQLLKTGVRKVPTKKTLEASAWLCAKIAREHKLGELVPGFNAWPHNKWVATACPGTLDWEWICAEANRINNELALAKKKAEAESTASPTTKPSKKEEVETQKNSNVASQQSIEYYTVVPNDSYWKIAGKLLGTKNAAKILKESNRLQKLNNNKGLNPGDKLIINKTEVAAQPVAEVKKDPAEYYTVKPNDSYWKIAGIVLNTKNAAKIVKEVKRLQTLNNNKGLNPGDKIRIK
jgi:LysM repeat protein